MLIPRTPRTRGLNHPDSGEAGAPAFTSFLGVLTCGQVDTSQPHPRVDLRGTAGHSGNKEIEWKKTIKHTVSSVCNHACLQSRVAPV